MSGSPSYTLRRDFGMTRHIGKGSLRTALVLVVAAMAGCDCGSRGEDGAPSEPAVEGRRPVIAVIPKGTTHEFWKSIHAGANKAGQELKAQGTDIEVIWKGPLREDDREQQIQVVEGFAAQGVSGIVLAPLDDRALVQFGRASCRE